MLEFIKTSDILLFVGDLINSRIIVELLKDARSVSSYPYNQPQILQNVKYTK